MFCAQCGKQLRDGAKFCGYCGIAVHKENTAQHTVLSSHAQQGSPSTVIPQPQSITTPCTSVSSAGMPPVPSPPLPHKSMAGSDTSHIHKWWIGVAAVIVLALVVAGISIALSMKPKYYTVPSLADVATAQEAENRLKNSGIQVTRVQQYSAEDKGTYLGLGNEVHEGDQVAGGEQVTVLESLGPGVPKGTVGQSQEDALALVEHMGVGVKIAKVVSQQAQGTVVYSLPADGEAVQQAQNGIMLVVATQGTGVPVDIAGMSLPDAQALLKQFGFTVHAQPRVASEENINKVVGSDPSIGEETDENTVTLYYGVDAAGLKKSMINTENMGDVSYNTYSDLTAILGKWCNGEGECHTISPVNEKEWNREDVSPTFIRSRVELESSLVLNGWLGALSPFPFSQDISGALDYPENKALQNHLVTGNTGAVEVYDNDTFPFCGTTRMGGVGKYCDHGVLKPLPSSGDYPTSTDLQYSMNEFVLVMPVGVDIDALYKQGYFGEQSTSKPDATRPYILVRDPSLYDESERTQACDEKSCTEVDPFIPNTDGKLIPFKPAPSATSAYYYVEEPIDWASLTADAEEICPSQGCTSQHNEQSTQS